MKDAINFSELGWTYLAGGVKEKSVFKSRTRIRLISFPSLCREKDFCLKGHWGYVLEGKLQLEFEDRVAIIDSEEAFVILKGDKHRLSIPEGQTALVLVFETEQDEI